MSFYQAWTKKPVAAAMIVAVFIALALVALLDVRVGPAADRGRATYAVIINYYGIDAGRIERDIAQPLENAVAVIPGIDELSSVSEYGKARLTVTLTERADANEVYLLLRDAVDRVYGQMPSSAQKPVIVSSTMEKRPIFIASFKSDRIEKDQLGRLVEKEIKAAFERIDGTGEIDVGGGEVREIHIQVRPERAAEAGLTVADIARVINMEDVLMPVGSLSNRLSDVPLVVKGRFRSLDELKSLMVNVPGAGPQPLGLLADIAYGAREKDSLARVNGEEQTTIYVESSGSANLVGLSHRLREEIRRWEARGLETDIILDTGREMEESIRQVFNAIIAGVILVVALLAVSAGSLRQIVLLSLLLPLICLFTIGLLSLFRISLDIFVLAGLAVGIGNVVDGAIVLTEACRSRRLSAPGEHQLLSLKEVIPPLLSSVLTTIVVLVPLFFLGDFAEGIRSVTISVGLLMIVSLITTIIFVPPFFLYKYKARTAPKPRWRKWKPLKLFSPRRLSRLLYASTLLVVKKPLLCVAGFLGLLGLAAAVLFVMGKDLSGIKEENTVYTHIEFDSGDTMESCDERATLLADAVRRLPGVERAETNAHFGNAEMVVRFRTEVLNREKLITAIQDEGRRIPGSFVYVPESAGAGGQKIEAAVLGDDNRTLRELAGWTAKALGGEPWVDQVVLHFKEGPPLQVFSVDRDKLAASGLTVAAVAEGLRWSLHGPVALKWIENGQEMDLRVMAGREAAGSLAAIKRSVFPLANGRRTFLEQLGGFHEVREESKIYRKNRQRAIFFTVHTKGLDLDGAAQKLRGSFSRLPLPEGYAFEIDKSVARASSQFKLLWLVLGLAVALIYMILASQSESLLSPLLVSATVPLSLVFPIFALFLIGRPLTTPAIIGLVILSGMAVNNSLLIADLVRENVRKLGLAYTPRAIVRPVLFALRRRIRDLLLTSATSVFGALPLLALPGGDSGMLSSLSFIVFWGILGSLVVTLFFLPALIVLFPKMLKSYAPGEGPGDISRSSRSAVSGGKRRMRKRTEHKAGKDGTPRGKKRK